MNRLRVRRPYRMREFGVALGVAIMGSIYFGLLTSYFGLLTSPTRAAFTAPLSHTLSAVAGLQVLTFAFAFLLPRRLSLLNRVQWIYAY